MKIHFTASITRGNIYHKNYKAIIKILQDFGHTVLSKKILHKHAQDIIQESIRDKKQVFKQLTKWIDKADILIAEISTPSLGVGQEINYALSKKKPVLGLYIKSTTHPIPAMLQGSPSRLVALASYNLTNIEKILKKYFKNTFIKKETPCIRFTFRITPLIQKYLDWQKNINKIPKAEFLREAIIEKIIKPDKKFQKNK